MGGSADESFFSSSWSEARAKFVAAAKAAGASVEVLRYDSSEGFAGVWRSQSLPPQLTIDVALLGDPTTATGLLLHSSGVHGIEGYAGSAIQTAFLTRVANDAPGSALPAGVCVAFVHGVNAHGMAEHRRWNERGVDLNRNFIIDDLDQGAIMGVPVTFSSLAAQDYSLYRRVYSLINPVRLAWLPALDFYWRVRVISEALREKRAFIFGRSLRAPPRIPTPRIPTPWIPKRSAVGAVRDCPLRLQFSQTSHRGRSVHARRGGLAHRQPARTFFRRHRAGAVAAPAAHLSRTPRHALQPHSATRCACRRAHRTRRACG